MSIQSYYTTLARAKGNLAAEKPDNWPGPLAEEALHGIVGDVVQVISPHTESDTVALLIQLLVAFGNLIGPTAHFCVDGVQHFLNLFVVLVGATAKSRKGTSWSRIRQLAHEVDSGWNTECVQTGLSSGEGLIWAVRDPIESTDPVRRGGKVVACSKVISDQGVQDKRLLVVESEFASTLKMTSRDGSTLSSVLRQAWDGDTLQIINKNSPAKATAPHISLIGHITEPELRRYLTATEQANGFGNRFLWVLVKRSKLLPEGGSLTSEQLADLVVTHLFFAADFARNVAEMRRDEGARQLWKEVYPVLSAEHPGLLGAVTARAEAQVMRLACLYALLDQSAIIQVEHLWAALAVWHYCEQSARHVFSDALGDPVADDLLRALRRRPHGMTRTAISELFGKNRSAAEIGRALAVLLERGLVRFETEESDGKPGRPPERWYAVEKTPEGNQA